MYTVITKSAIVKLVMTLGNLVDLVLYFGSLSLTSRLESDENR